jgi:hypothetical protein
MGIYEKLINIQCELKAPKGQYNSFGKYNYRNCEDILEAVKPLCQKQGLCLILFDTIEQIGDRYYVKATARITDGETTIEATAYAREEEVKKGMDGSQITGSASSYARKYALNGLFDIDDTKDADSGLQGQPQAKSSKQGQPSKNTNSPSVICPKCGQPVGKGKNQDGTIAEPQQVLAKFGMCINCYRAIRGKVGAYETN